MVERNIPKWQNMIFLLGLFGSAFLTLCCVLLLLEWNTNHPVIFNFQDRTAQILKKKFGTGRVPGSVRAWSLGNMKIWKRIQLWIVANRCCLGSITLFLKTETVFIFCYQYSYIGRPPLSQSTSHETSQDKILAAPPLSLIAHALHCLPACLDWRIVVAAVSSSFLRPWSDHCLPLFVVD